MNEIRKYSCIFSMSFKTQSIYKLSVIFNIISCVCKLFIQINIWKSLISSNAKNSISLKDMCLYIVVNMLVLCLVNIDVSKYIEDNVRDGSISTYLVRPMSYKYYLFFDAIGKNVFTMTFTILPVVIITAMFIGIPFPEYAMQYLITLLFIIIGILISFELSYIIGLFAFWLQTSWFLKFYINGAITLFGGTAVPLWFYPKALRGICNFLPFRYITFEAINYYLNDYGISADIIHKLIIGIVWILLLKVTGHIIWKLALKKLSVNGG